jgi:hypothetical protein
MNKERFLQLHKQHCLETCYMSFTDTSHPAYIELATLKNEYGIVWTLERLKDSIEHDIGDVFDHDNDPWLSTVLLGVYTSGICWDGFPSEHAGMLDEIRNHLLQWGRNQNYI